MYIALVNKLLENVRVTYILSAISLFRASKMNIEIS